MLILAIFLASSMYSPAYASSNVAFTVQGQQVHAAFSLSLVQNLTILPAITTTVDSGSGSNISGALSQALANAYPPASASNFTLEIASTKKELDLTGGMDVVGVSRRDGDILSINMTWLPFSVNSDLRVQNFSFNRIGSTYFRSVVEYYANASRFVGQPNATISGVTFYANGTSVGPPTAEDYVGNFTTLRFDSLSPNLDEWNRTYTLTNNTTTWRYFPPRLLDFSMRVQRKNVTTDYVATYGYNATISVPGVGRAQGRVILADLGTGQTEWVMAAIVILSIVSAITVQLMFRNKKRKLARFQRK
jgi:hypothetical protein